MPTKSRFTRLDAFTKTVDEARIRTTSGGIVTIASLLVVLYLALGEWREYRRIVVHPELVVDKGRGERMEIHINVTFPKVPCELLSLDVMDVSGEQQSGIVHGVHKVRLQPASQGSGVIETKALDLHAPDQEALHLDPNYCGDCYGALAPPTAKKPGCCNTCGEVLDAYALVSWAFGKGRTVAQCEREHYAERLEEQKNEGCRIEGSLLVNKVVGNFHLAPGRSFSNGNMHVHDLKNYWATEPGDVLHDFTHTIHHLRFGPRLPERFQRELSSSTEWAGRLADPLDGVRQETLDPAINFMYFIKIVPTSFLPLVGTFNLASEILKEEKSITDLGAFGLGADGSVESSQYSVTSHQRSLSGGDDSAQGHSERLHIRGGVPGVFFSYDISPMKVINREKRGNTLAGFLTGLCAVIGGTLTVAAAIDRGVFEGVTRLNKIRYKDL